MTTSPETLAPRAAAAPPHSILPASKPIRIALLTVTGVLLVAFVLEFAWLWGYIDSQSGIDVDRQFYAGVGQHWLDTGELYSARQLAGPYVVLPNVDNLYPPTGLPFMLAVLWLPALLYYLIPLGTTAVLVAWWRPAAWTWPLLVFFLAWPRGVSNIIYGNSDIWIQAAVAGGLLVGWPALLILMKPSVLPFAVVGVRHRSFWIGAAVVAVASLFALELWREYFVAIGNSDAEWYYSLEDTPPYFLPIVAWLGRRDGGFATVGELLAWRPSWPPSWLPARLRGSGR